MRVAIIGCGYVAGLYYKTIPLYPEIEVLGAMDINPDRSTQFASYYGIHRYENIDEVVNDERVEIIINLTNPESHYQISKMALDAGKHVYCEKPLSMSYDDAKELVDLAESKNLLIVSAPSRILGETAQTMWKALREELIGKVRLVYAEMDDGLVHKMAYKTWKSDAGAPWPYKNEFELGCTLEHAGYTLTWLASFFGPAESITAFASCQIPEKAPEVNREKTGPDLTVANIKFVSGVVARVTCSLIAPADHSIRIFGDEGILRIDDCWKPRIPVRYKKRINILGRSKTLPWWRSYPLLKDPRPKLNDRKFKKVDFCLGITEMIEAINENRQCRLSGGFCLHITEMVLAIHNANNTNVPYMMKSTFQPMEPMPWAVKR